MRSLKFRAWDKKNGYYADYEDIEEEITAQAIDGWRSEDGGISFTLDCGIKDFGIEQYTGLKDRNGKEMYEGDIVKFADLELAMKPAGVVCFSDGKFFIKDWEFDDGSYHIVDFYDYNIPYRDFEVIGNIHENPELLEGQK